MSIKIYLENIGASLNLEKKKVLFSNAKSFLDDNMAYGKNFYLNALKSHMSKLKLINKDSSYEKMITKFNSLKNKDRVLKN